MALRPLEPLLLAKEAIEAEDQLVRADEQREHEEFIRTHEAEMLCMEREIEALAIAQYSQRNSMDESRARAEHARKQEQENVRAIKVRQEQEEAVRRQIRLQKMGPCAGGYEWVKKASGWECAGGNHYLSDNEAAIFYGV